MAGLATQLASLNPVQLSNAVTMRSCTQKASSTVLLRIECAKHAQKKCTAHHVKSRPKKHQPYDKNRKGPTVYPARGKPPPIWGYDTSDASADASAEVAVEVATA